MLVAASAVEISNQTYKYIVCVYMYLFLRMGYVQGFKVLDSLLPNRTHYLITYPNWTPSVKLSDNPGHVWLSQTHDLTNWDGALVQ